MHFKSGSIKPKATLEIGDKTYTIKCPTIGQSTKLAELLEDAKSTKEQSHLMKQFICDLGQIEMQELETLEAELFNQLFDYVITSKKN